MDCLNAQNIEFGKEKNRIILFSIGLILCFSCCLNRKEYCSDYEVFQLEEIPTGNLELIYKWDSYFFVISLENKVLSYKTCFDECNGEKFSVYLDGDSLRSITYGDLHRFFNDSIAARWRPIIRQNGRILKGQKALFLKNYLTALLLENSPVIPNFSCMDEESVLSYSNNNNLYRYDKPIEWKSVEVAIGDGNIDYSFYPYQSMKIYHDTLVFDCFGDITKYSISKQQSDRISQLLKGINIESSLYSYSCFTDVYGEQLYVNNNLIYQSYPAGFDEDITSVPYKNLIDYIVSLCPEEFVYDYAQP